MKRPKAELEASPPADPVPRREFFRRVGAASGVALAGVAAAIWLNRRPDRFLPPEGQRLDVARFRPLELRHPLAVVEGQAVDGRTGAGNAEVTGEMVEALFDALGGIERVVREGDIVLIKPNVAFARSPLFGATTNPAVVEAVARTCLGAGAARVLVADYPINDPQGCFARTGILEAARRAGADVVLPAPEGFEPVAIQGCEVLPTWPIFIDPLRRATRIIGIAPVKHHTLSGASLTMKNWYGLLGGERNRFHQSIHAIIRDLCLLSRSMNPLLVLDGTRILFRNGPTGGSLRDVRAGNVIAGGSDPVAIDAFGAELLGLEPQGLGFIRKAQESGFGTLRWQELAPARIKV